MAEINLFYLKIKEQAMYLNKSINQIEKELGYPRNALHNYKQRVPSGKRLIELAKYFKVSPEYLIEGELANRLISTRGLFCQLSPAQKLEMNQLCQEWINSQFNFSNKY